MNTLDRIKIENFIIFDQVDVELGQDVFFITGENRDEINQDSNGSGKTAFCTAFVWCLFEDNLRKGMLKDDVIGPNKDYCEVTLYLSNQNGVQYQVTRYRNHPDYGNDVIFKIDGEDVSHQTSKKKTTKRIQRELGLNENLLYYCSYLSTDTDSLVGLAPYKMKKVVSDLVRISPLKEWVSDLKSIKSDKEQKVQNLTQKIDSKEEYLNTERDTLDDLRQDLKDHQRNKEKKIEKLKDKIEDKKDDIQRIEDSVGDIDEQQERYEELKYVADKIDNINRAIKDEEQSLETKKKKKSQYKNRLNTLNAKASKYKDNLDNLVNNPTGECKVCGNLINDSDKKEKKIKEFQNKINDIKPKIADAKMNYAEVNQKIEKINKKINSLKRTRAERREEYEEFKEIEKKIENCDNMRKMKESAEQDIDDFHEQIREIQDYPVENKKEMIKGKEENIEKIESDIETFETQKKDAQEDIDAAETLIESIQTVRKSKLNDFIENFDKVVNQNLNELTGGDFKSRVNKDGDDFQLEFTAPSKDGKYLGYGIYSTGEQVRINKAVISALGQILDVGFLIDDEGFSGLDSSGVSGIMDYILEKNKNKTLLFVGHESKVKDRMAEYNNLHIIKENGTSRIVRR